MFLREKHDVSREELKNPYVFDGSFSFQLAACPRNFTRLCYQLLYESTCHKRCCNNGSKYINLNLMSCRDRVTLGCYSLVITNVFTDLKRTEVLLLLPVGKREPKICSCLGLFDKLLEVHSVTNYQNLIILLQILDPVSSAQTSGIKIQEVNKIWLLLHSSSENTV